LGGCRQGIVMSEGKSGGSPWEDDRADRDAKPGPSDQTGRLLGPRARETRNRLLKSTKDLLDAHGLRDLRVIDIARNVGASPATFYQYFKDVEDAVLTLAELASSEMPAMAEYLEGSWSEPDGLDRARAIVDGYIRHWDDHHSVLRVRNLASDEGDLRFRTVRATSTSPMLRGLARLIENAQDAGQISRSENPQAAAAAMGAILERMAAYHVELESGGVSRDDLVETCARILHRTVTGLTESSDSPGRSDQTG
jgi:AcrR family transcriptional regulator